MNKNKFYGMCTQGNIVGAMDYLRACDNDKEAETLLHKYHHRFVLQQQDHIDTGDSWVDKVLISYNNYFKTVLVGGDIDGSDDKLKNDLIDLVSLKKESKLDDVEDEIKEILLSKGYQFLGGTTGQYRGPYIWRSTDKSTYKVDLPTSTESVTIFFVSDFIMLSWLYYATFGARHTGGWAKEEGLYYVVKDGEVIDDASDNFQVQFLKHEAQHLYDFEHHPDYRGYELEYRAKLIELMYHPDSKLYIEKFIAEALNDTAKQHSYASWLIVEGLKHLLNTQNDSELKGMDEAIRQAATELFEQSEEKLAELKC